MKVSYEKEMIEKAKAAKSVLVTIDINRKYTCQRGKQFTGGRSTVQSYAVSEELQKELATLLLKIFKGEAHVDKILQSESQ